MFFQFFDELRSARIPVTLKEYLALMDALDHGVIDMKVDQFYYLSRTALVKDERNLDKFDRVFGHVFKGLENIDPTALAQVPEEWLRALTEKFLTEEEKKQIEALGGWEKLMETLKQRLEEQKKRHEGGNKMIGSGGTSPFGNSGYNPEGVRIGQDKSRHGKAVKVWDKREYKNLDDSVELGTRNIKVALRRLRKWARQGAEVELDLPGTIQDTANKGYLDLRLIPERHNTVKVLIFFDIGGSMDAYIKLCEELFSAAKTEFKHMEFFYFHNCLYESVWKDNRRRHNEKTQHLGRAAQIPARLQSDLRGRCHHEPLRDHLSRRLVEHWNEEAGALWLDRVAQIYEHVVWLNPVAEKHWEYTPSIGLINQIISRPHVPADARRPRQGDAGAQSCSAQGER